MRTLVDTPIPERSPPRICPSNATRLSGLLLSPVSSMNSSFTHCRGHVSPAIHLTSAPSDRRPHTACRFPFRVYPPQQVVSSLRAGARWALRNSGGCASEQFPCSKTLPLLSLTRHRGFGVCPPQLKATVTGVRRDPDSGRALMEIFYLLIVHQIHEKVFRFLGKNYPDL